jgi:hypothetical protein
MDGDEVAGETDDDDSKNPMNVRTTAYQQERTDWLLHALVQQFPPATTVGSSAL